MTCAREADEITAKLLKLGLRRSVAEGGTPLASFLPQETGRVITSR